MVNQDDWHSAIRDWWNEIDARALASKNSQEATIQWIEQFRELDEYARSVGRN